MLSYRKGRTGNCSFRQSSTARTHVGLHLFKWAFVAHLRGWLKFRIGYARYSTCRDESKLHVRYGAHDIDRRAAVAGSRTSLLAG